jgi:hypothetical protein
MRQEPDRLSGPTVGAAAFAVALASCVYVLVAYVMDRDASGSAPRQSSGWLGNKTEVNGLAAQRFDELPPAVRLAHEARAQLGSYGWVDRDAGLVHIPLEVARGIYLSQQQGAAR